MHRPRRPTLPANRPLAALVAADGISRFGDWIYLVALPVLVLNRTGSEVLVGLTVAGRLLPFLLLSMPAGAAADRLSRTGILVVAETTRAVAMAVAALLCALTTDVGGVIVAASVAAAAGTFAMPAFMSLVPQAARSDAELGRANAAMATIDGLAGILGPALAGVLIVVGGLPAAFLLNGVTFAVLVATVLALGASLRAQPTVAGDVPATLAAPSPPELAITWSTLVRGLAPQLCLDGAVSLVSAALGVLTVLVAVKVVGADSAFAGPLNAASGAGALVGALVAGRLASRHSGRGATLAIAVLLGALVLLATPGQPVAALIAMGGTVAALVLLDTLNVTAVQVAAGNAATGRAIGLLHTLAAAWMLVGIAIATIVAATAGAGAAVLAVALSAGALGGAGLVLGHLKDRARVARLPVLVSSPGGFLVKRAFTTAVLALLLVTIVAGIALGFLAPIPPGAGLPGIGDGASTACGPAALSAIERPLDDPAHRLAWSTGPRVGAWHVVVADADGTNRTTLISSETFSGEPAWSPDGTKVAFVQRDDREVDHIWVADKDGSNARLLVPEAGSPAWSPDGTRVAYWSGKDGAIWTTSLLEPVPHRLVSDADLAAFDDKVPFGHSAPEHFAWGRPAWAPDGTRLVFELMGPAGSDLVMATLDGRVQRMTDTPGCNERQPAWTPDGERILFVADGYGADGVPADLFAIDGDGSGRERLTATGDRSEEAPAVSPDGRTIAVGLSLENGMRTGIAVMNADGTGAQPVSLDSPANASGSPAWIP